MSGIHLKDLSKVYKEQIAEKKDDSYLETDMKKRQKNNEKARKDMKKMGSMSNPHFGDGPTGSMSSEEVEVDEAMSSYDRNRKRAAQRAADRNAARAAGKTGVVPGVGYVSPRKERETYVDSAGTTRHKSGAKMEGLDPVGKEDGDVNNDGKKDSTDSYLMKRRKAIGKAIKSKMSEGVRDMDPEKGTAERKARLEKKRGMKMDDHPEYKKEEYIPEVMTDSMDEKPIKEKKVKNTVKINPKMGESVEEIGGELIEAVEIFDILEEITDEELRFISDKMIDQVVEEFFAEAVEKDEDLEVLQQNLCESIDLSISILLEQDAGAEARKRLMSRPARASVMDRVKSAVKKGAKMARKAAVKGAEVAGKAVGHTKNLAKDMGSAAKKGYQSTQTGSSDSESSSTPKKKGPGMLSRIGAKLKRGIGKAARAVSRGARNVARKMDEAVYGGTKKPAPTDPRMLVTNADKKANTPAYQKMKAGDKRYKAADHMGEEMSPQEIQMQKKKATLDKMIAMKRKQQLDKTKAEPVKAMGEAKELSIDDQMRISREANAKRKPYQPGDRMKQRAAQIKQMVKNAPKDTRTDAQKMADATGPRPGSRYRGD